MIPALVCAAALWRRRLRRRRCGRASYTADPARAASSSPAFRPARNSREFSTSSPRSSILRRTRWPTRTIDVQIDMNSVDSMDKDRDGTMRGRGHFRRRTLSDRPLRDSQHQRRPRAGYSAIGALTLHGVTKDVPIDFQFAADRRRRNAHAAAPSSSASISASARATGKAPNGSATPSRWPSRWCSRPKPAP